MLIGLLLALGCSVCYGTATVLQAAATRSVNSGDSDSGVDAALLLRALRQWRYLVGIGLDGLGFRAAGRRASAGPDLRRRRGDRRVARCHRDRGRVGVVHAVVVDGVGRSGGGLRKSGDARRRRRAGGHRARPARTGLGAAGDRRRGVRRRCGRGPVERPDTRTRARVRGRCGFRSRRDRRPADRFGRPDPGRVLHQSRHLRPGRRRGRRFSAAHFRFEPRIGDHGRRRDGDRRDGRPGPGRRGLAGRPHPPGPGLDGRSRVRGRRHRSARAEPVRRGARPGVES